MLKKCCVVLIVCLISFTQASFAKPGNLAEKQILRRGNGSEVQTLDPHKAEGVPASNILRDLYEGLTIESPDGKVIPGAAESWEISDDGRVYTFHIRKDARWSNGDPVTAADFVYGLRRSVDPATGSQYSQILAPILNTEDIISGKKPVDSMGVEAIDDHTLKITLKAATPYLLGLLNHSTTYPVHRGSVEQHGEQFSRPGKLVSNGAYMLKEWKVQSQIVVARNLMYWDNDNTIIEEVVYLPIEEASAELKRYRAGELDITGGIPTNQYSWIMKNLPGELHVSPTLGTYYYGFNLTRPPFKGNLKLRQALSMAVDREILTEKITKAGEIPAYGWVPPGVNNYSSQSLDYAKMPKAERIKKAQQLYQEAGYSRGNPLTVEIRYNTSENHKKIAVGISAMWKKNLGIRTKLINEEWKVFLENRKQKKLTEAFRGGWIGDYNDAFTFSELMQSDHGINDSGYNSPEYDKLLEQAATESDLDKRRSILESAERLLLKDHAIMPLYFYVTKHLIKPYVKGYQPNILDHTYSKNLWISKH
jgi:oligopeptide transport system substrate-binding protein